MTFRYQEFVSPGTWTWPGTVSTVRVTVVGGGGGSSSAAPGISAIPSGGGGGAVITKWMPVSAPVPITVGAGGTGSDTYSNSTPGGTSYFGPAGPGPVPAIPTATVAAGGGFRAQDTSPTPLYPISGGGGQSGLNPPFSVRGGAYGSNSSYKNGGAGGKNSITILEWGQNAGSQVAIGEDYYGNGGAGSDGVNHYGSPAPAPSNFASPAPNANTGAGGTAYTNPGSSPGSSGIVIVRWFE